jgi:fructuronate reductase
MPADTSHINLADITALPRLSASTLEAANASRPAYDRSTAEIAIVHFGPGAFHRAHQAYYTDKAMALSGGNWGICGVSLNSRGAAEALAPQDGLYTLAVKDKQPEFRIIGSLKEVLCARDEPQKVMQRLIGAETKIVTLTITEKGYALDPSGRLDVSNVGIAHDLDTPQQPVSAIGYLVEACRLRREAGLSALTLMSCDNLPENGDKLQTACLSFAEKIDPELADYIKAHISFPNTMVDSITPASDSKLLSDVAAQIGLSDAGAINRESFTQWVIEDKLPDDVPDWVGAGVIITDDVSGYEMTKLRILNGAHITLTYLGLLLGLETVEAAISHSELAEFVDGLMHQETMPTINPPEGLSLKDYWSATQARFENPHIRHLLEQISHDGSQKIPARIFPVIGHHIKGGKASPRACIVVSAWIEFNRQRRAAGDAPKDGYLTQIEADLPSLHLSAEEYASAFMELEGLFPSEILADEACRARIIQGCQVISEKGMSEAMKENAS